MSLSTSTSDTAARRYSIGLLGCLAGLLAVLAAVNVVVDPYDYFRWVQLTGFNIQKPAIATNLRLVRSAQFAREHAQAVVLGSSFSLIGLRADHPALIRAGQLKPFSLALPGAESPEVACYAEFAFRHGTVERAIAGGLNGTSRYGCPSGTTLGRVEYGKLLLSRTALTGSIETLRGQERAPGFSDHGLWFYHRFDPALGSADAILNSRFIAELGTLRRNCRLGDRTAAAASFDRINRSKPGEHEGEGLRRVLRAALDNKMELAIIAYPWHVILNELVRLCDGPEFRWNNLYKMAQIVEQEVPATSNLISLWDFYDYTGAHAESVFDPIPMRDRVWQDLAHFNPEIGDRIIEEIFGTPSGYGRRVAAADFAAQMRAVESRRQAFLDQNPKVRGELHKLIDVAGIR